MRVTNQIPTDGMSQIDKAKQIDKQSPINKNDPSQSSQSAKAPGASRIDISEEARMMQGAKEAVSDLPDVNGDRVSQLKARIQEGTYQIDSGRVAERLIEEHLNTDFGKNNL